jgi:predicted TIM-barrel fold metal-dependent hydrolase
MSVPEIQLCGGRSRRIFLQTGMAGASAWMLGTAALGRETSMKDPLQEDAIDAHVHVWTSDTGRYPLAPGYRKDRMALPSFTPEELFAHTRPSGVARIVLIQVSYYGFDNSYLLDVMRKHEGTFSGVAGIDENATPRETMLRLARQGVRGFRIRPGTRPPEEWLEGDGMAAMWRCGADQGLAICPLIDPQYLPALDRMCRRFPETPVVVDHFARIGADGVIRQPDLDNLCGLSRHNKAYVKVSAFYALGQKKAPYLDLGPMIRRLLDAFGPERLMWASDSPFQVIGGHRYEDSIGLIRSRLDFLTHGDRQWLLRRTAERVFFSGP